MPSLTDIQQGFDFGKSEASQPDAGDQQVAGDPCNRKARQTMATLDFTGYDFLNCFPAPNDASRHRAGRRGMLDQKENAGMGDGDWVAYQHACWIAELRELHKGLRYLRWAELRGIDPGTGRAVRNPQRWPGIRNQVLAETRSMEAQLCALLDDYSNFFGLEAADRFGDFVRRRSMPKPTRPAQVELFQRA